MARYRVPTAGFKVFDNPDMADRYIEIMGAPCVIKADGLAAGKGVVVAKTVTEAQGAVDDMMRKKIFGPAGKKIIVEDYLKGQEASILVFTDSKNVIPLASSQDHKRIFDNDQGLNTGGMGAYSPAPMVSEDILREILDRVIYRLIDGLVKEEIYYHGVLYAGIMLTNQGPKALEFNVRFGDPETQAVLPRLKTDVVELMIASAEGRLMRFRPLRWDERSCVCVVISAGGYPGEYEKGKEITGLDEVSLVEDVVVFHAGTKLQNSAPDLKGTQHKYVTSGGRVLGVAGLGETIQEAIDKTYQAFGRIKFEGMHYRRDIGYKALMTNNKILPQ
jgi:phosphoribosylamine--glycine ligase